MGVQAEGLRGDTPRPHVTLQLRAQNSKIFGGERTNQRESPNQAKNVIFTLLKCENQLLWPRNLRNR